MIYFSTSNASPWLGASREGENLFTASIVALDAETGEYKWHYQMVHHDIWDFDAPSPTVLFKGEMNGEEVEAVGEPEKTGWVYLLDQETGKPIYPIPEVKVPQDPSQKTWPTQPEPTMEPFSPLTADRRKRSKTARPACPGRSRNRKSSAAKCSTPMSTDPNVINLVANAAAGGNNWPPSSYNPEANTYVVCSLAGALGLVGPGRTNRSSNRAKTRSAPKSSPRPASTSKAS